MSGPFINLEYEKKTGIDNKFEGTAVSLNKPMVLRAYYPFTGEEGTAPGDNGIISVSTTADNQKPENQPQIDFLWADKKDITLKNTTIDFVFTHRMTKLSFTFKNSENTKAEDIVAYQIEGLGLAGTFDTNTGECSINDNAKAEDLRIDFAKRTAKDNEPLDPVIVFPQQPIGTKNKPGKVILRLFLDEPENASVTQIYTCELNFGETGLVAGHHYKFTVTITKTGLKIEKMAIKEWDGELPVNINTTIE